MRSIKTTDGMVRCRGMTDGQRAQWLMSMLYCAEMNIAMQELTGVNFRTSEQYKKDLESRKTRDPKDIETFAPFLVNRNPFTEEQSVEYRNRCDSRQKSKGRQC